MRINRTKNKEMVFEQKDEVHIFIFLREELGLKCAKVHYIVDSLYTSPLVWVYG